ncbi:hypothetical protein [Sporolactobacillus terrae]|uniref:hypothetical protein n=1 Tax=Sporolactobacillus terrae TaxID=269673 RepID=UPI000ABF16EE|nr:hypothetical protein [Sporolactobacillus terrae]UAK16757.1 hypothetical protein K7399_01970 [Sporolactobacillus terrae]
MPLVYSATIGLGYSAKTVLEAKQNDKKVSNEEIKKIAKDYAKNARQEKRILVLQV